MTGYEDDSGNSVRTAQTEPEGGTQTGGPASPYPGALWGLGQIATYLGRSRETLRLCWQATKARAADPAAAAAGDALPVPDFLIPDNSNGIHGFFHATGDRPTGDRLVADWWTLPAVRPVWRPEVIAVWASTTGRAVRGHADGDYRLPVPHFLDLPALPKPLPRTVDRVLGIPAGYRTADTRGLHVRIWDGPLPEAPGPSGAHAEDARRTVVLLAATGKDYGFPQREDELAALLLEAGLLTPEQARRALWFQQTPPDTTGFEGGGFVHRPGVDYISFAIAPHGDARNGELSRRHRLSARITAAVHRIDGGDERPLHHPTCLRASVTDVERLIGERLEIYPPGTQTAEVIARWAAGERPVRLAWDPYRLGEHLTHLPVVTDALAAARADLAAAPDDPARRVAVLRAAATWIADLALSKATSSLLHHGYAEDGLRAVDLDIPVPTAEQRALLEAVLADDEPGPYVLTVLLRDLAAVTGLAATLPMTPPGGQPGTDTPLGDALGNALAIMNDHFHLHRGTFDERIPSRVEETDPARPDDGGDGESAAAYLTTIAWWGPRPDDRQTADDLARLFYEHEHRNGLQHGYDPFGRLVVRCPAARAFAVAWPARRPVTVADVTLGRPGFHRLPDGRVDLMPVGGSPA